MHRSMRLALLPFCVSAVLSFTGCTTDDVGAPHAAMASAARHDGPLTHDEASLACWMQLEHGHATLSLDRRADLVDRCVRAKMKAQPPR